jgi:hypothetical protein
VAQEVQVRSVQDQDLVRPRQAALVSAVQAAG